MTMTTSDSALVDVLVSLGVDVRSSDGKEINGRCPVHLARTGKEDRSPSWSMNATTGLWICFSCGARGSLPMLVSELTGDHDVTVSVHTMLIDAGVQRLTEPSSATALEPIITHEDLITFAGFKSPPKDYVKKRNLTTEALERYSIRWDADREAWVLPIMSPLGELKGWQLKGSGWVRNYPKGVKSANSLFGFSQMSSRTAVLVESPLDVVRFAGVFSAPQAVATFGANVSDIQMRMLSMSVDRLVLAMDDDVAGWKSMKRLFSVLPTFRKGVWFFDYADSTAKDIGEMTSDEIELGVFRASLIPPWSTP